MTDLERAKDDLLKEQIKHQQTFEALKDRESELAVALSLIESTEKALKTQMHYNAALSEKLSVSARQEVGLIEELLETSRELKALRAEKMHAETKAASTARLEPITRVLAATERHYRYGRN